MADYGGHKFDPATVAGLIGGFVLIVAAIALGSDPLGFIDLPSVLIVIGGTLAVTTISFKFSEIGGTARVLMRTVNYRERDPSDAAYMLIRIAEHARRNGVLGLQGQVLASLKSEQLLHKALSLVVDGVPGEEVERMMRQEIQATIHRHTKASGVLRRAAEVSPAMGLIGTLIGLVQMLGNLDDPSTIGPAMAVALLTTFYGAILANMVFAPLASKLDRNSQEEALVYHLYTLGVMSIAKQENPRRLEMLLNSVLPPAQRVRVYD